MPASVLEAHAKPETRKAIRCVDCDIHQFGPGKSDMLKHLPKAWHERYGTGAGTGHLGFHNPVGVTRRDCVSADGKHGAASPKGLAEHLLDPYEIDIGILTGGVYNMGVHPDPDYADAVCSAYNAAVLETWIPEDDRLRFALSISTRDAALTAKEIRRHAGHPKVVAAIAGSACTSPLGQRQFLPIMEACEETGLPLMLHPGAEGTGICPPPTACGYPTRYLEWHTDIIQSFQTHVVSLVCEGVFQKFPKLKVVLVEGGISWLVPLMWRFDKNWKALRSTVPWLDRKPSEVIQEHFLLTTQPIEEPDNHEHLIQLFNMFDAKNMLMFASDFPHWDGDTPNFALRGFPDEFKQRVKAQNAIDLFRLQSESPLRNAKS
ncbi:MAG: amidohydrolase [Planctomycetota bacterium]|nr:amidohydrolase [Planctomycetota bacterium]